MSRLVVSSCALLLAACASVSPMAPDSARDMKTGKVVVAFFDGVEQINYREDVYLVLGVAQVASNSVYGGFWDSSKEISAMHTSEFAKLGVRATSLYDIVTESERAELATIQKEMYSLYSGPTKVQDESLLKPRFRDLLLGKGNDYLVWATWSGYLFHIHTLGLPPHEAFTTTYWVFDLKGNRIVWNGSIGSRERVEMREGLSGKDFLEKDNLAGLKSRVANMIKERHKGRTGRGIYSNSVGQIMGLEVKNE